MHVLPFLIAVCSGIFCLLYNFAQALAEEKTEPIIISASTFNSQTNELAGSAKALELSSIVAPTFQDTNSILEQFANVNFSSGSSEIKFFQIRGIGELEQYEGAPNPSVGLIYDNLDLSGLGVPFTFFDIEKVEVLRGPQANQFGSSALAGVVNLKTFEPTKQKSLNSRLTFGSDDLQQFGLGFGSQVLDSDQLSFRLTLANESQDGFRENLFLNSSETNERNKSDSRLQIRYEPSKETTIDLEALYALQDHGYDAFTINNGFTTQSDRPGKDRHELQGGKISIIHKLDETLNLQSLTSASDSQLDYGFDGDWGNNPFWAPFDPYDFRSFSARNRRVLSQEIRLQNESESIDNWQLGIFAQKLDENTDISEFADEIIYDSLSSNYEARTYAGFAGYEFKLGEGWGLGSTFRGEYRDTEYSDSNAIKLDPDFNMQGGSVYLQKQINPSQQAYLLFSRGYKGGGFNAGTRVPDDQIEYRPETLWNYEIGNKGKAFQNKLDYRLSVFYMRRYDQQIERSFQDDPSDPLSFTFVTDNAAEGQNYGLEFEGSFVVGEKTDLTFALGLLDTKIETSDPTLTNLMFREQAHAPNWNYNVALIHYLSNNWYFKPSISSKDSFYFDDSHDQKSNQYVILSCETAWIIDALKISLWARNLTDERYATRGFFFGNEPPDFNNELYIQRGDPFHFGITLTYALN